MSKKLQLDRYSLDQSPLFRMRGKGQFTLILGIDWDSIQPLLVPSNYRVWLNEKGREIQQPIGRLQRLHARIGGLLARIEIPDYVFSQKGRSYADNAHQHVGNMPLVKTDIHRFYPSTTWAMVKRMFVDDFQCAPDVAKVLADLCCYRQEHLPTGSPLSGRIAFFAARKMFDEVARLAEREECRMTAYVDDLTISGQSATKQLLGEVRQVVSRHGLKTKQAKSRTFAASASKPVTGAIIAGSELRLPNERHLKIHQTRLDLAAAPHEARDRIKQVLRGRLQEAKQVIR